MKIKPVFSDVEKIVWREFRLYLERGKGCKWLLRINMFAKC